MIPLILNIEDVFCGIFVVIAGGLLFYLPALLLSFFTGGPVRLGSRLLGYKVKASTSLDKVIQKQNSTLSSAPQSPILVSYQDLFGDFLPLESQVRVVLNRTVKLKAIPEGGKWMSSDKSIATIDVHSGVVTGNSLGETTIFYECESNHISFSVLVRPQRTLPFKTQTNN